MTIYLSNIPDSPPSPSTQDKSHSQFTVVSMFPSISLPLTPKRILPNPLVNSTIPEEVILLARPYKYV